MAIPNKMIKIPDMFFGMECTISYKGELDRYGEYSTTDITFPCRFHQQTKRILDAEHNLVVIVGCVLIDGSNNVGNPIDCDITINGTTFKVYTCKGIIDPDNKSIHHYKLELI